MGSISSSNASWLDGFINKHTKTTEATGEIYLAAGGYYQKSYIAIFEDLTSNIKDEDTDFESNESNVDFIADLFIKELIIKYPEKKLPFNKIVSVTLPSQIIAKAITDKFERRDDLLYFQSNIDGVDSYSTRLPNLIRLASYYSFTDEVQFKNIVSNDKVLIVNDVISTGALIFQIYKSISGLNFQINVRASISCVLSVVDSRVRLQEAESDVFKQSKYFNFADFKEENFISLKEIKIYKYIDNPEPQKKLIRINPILNSRITMESRHSEEDKIAYKDADEFLKQLPSQTFKIGHFAQNSLHHSYFLTPADLFAKNELGENLGIRLIKNVVKKIEKIERGNNVTYYGRSIRNQLKYLEEICNDLNHPKKAEFSSFRSQLEEYLFSIELSSVEIINKNFKLKRLIKRGDFVFYPVFSGIENLHKIDFQDIFEVDYSNIIPLQRFDTNKGWRFIIPQKSYNSRLKGKSALIIDMGSFTGDSIIQMIDALCVFELKKIIVLSLVGRLEDFDREFFSRIQEMKIKILKDSTQTGSNAEDRLAPVKIYFGVNLHIPPSLSSKVCEQCMEISMLKIQREIEVFKKVQAVDYINERIGVLELVHVSDISHQCPQYMPKNPDGTYDVIGLFEIRNHLGKIDGYRFYTDFYHYFDDLKLEDSDYNKKIEGILAVCLHENHLLHTVTNQLPDVRKKIRAYVNEIIDGTIDFSNLYYQWDILSILQCYFLINSADEDILFSIESLTKIFDFIVINSSDDSIYLKFLAYKFSENYHLNRNLRSSNSKIFGQTPLINSVKKIWQDIEPKKHLRYHSLITHFNRLIVNEELVAGTEAVKPFYELFRMYDIASAYHPNHTDFANSMNTLKTTINGANSKRADIIAFKKELDEAEKQLVIIEQNLLKIHSYLNGLIKLFKTNTFAVEYISGDKSLSNYLLKIRKLLSSRLTINIRFDRVWQVIEQIEKDYFSLSNADNFYNLWKTSNYLTALDVLSCFQNQTTPQNIQLFRRFFKPKNYASRIKEELNSFLVVFTKAYKDVGVNMHPYLLIHIFKELLDNSFRHAYRSDVKISLTTESNFGSGVTYTVIRYKQNAVAKGEPANGLIDVAQIITDFNGTFSFIPRKKSVLIKILIPITHYKLNV